MRFQGPAGLIVIFGLLWVAISAAAEPASPAALISTGRVDDAIRLLKERLRSVPNDAPAYHLLTRTYFYMGRWNEAVAAAERAVALEPSSSDYQLWLARAVGEKAAHSGFVNAIRMVPKIRGAFERAVQLDGSNATARTDLAEFYMEAPAFLGGGRDKAASQAELLAPLDPAAAHWVKAQLAEHAKSFEAAEQEYQAAIAASRNAGNRWLDLAGFYQNRGRLDQMEHAIGKAVSADNRQSTVLYEAAALLFQAGRNGSGTIELLQKYLARDSQPESAPAYQAHYLLGQVFEKQRDNKSAAAQYRAALALAREFEPARYALKRVSQ